MAGVNNNLIPGQGRPAGAKNKKTLQAEAALDKYLLEKNALFVLLDDLFYRLQNERSTVRTADVVNAIKMIASYQVRTVSERESAERLDQIMATENPDQMKAEILDFVGKLKAV
ncbi:hypothetical protein [Serratia marcescens]|uniref:Uncharacterized protein n=1 Tax=Serratia marcescens TaxID=615 RepID=A0AAP8PI19_SERMA|nr:hypothetical protein [Serratia marcescens]PNO65052.1 hypothetical protein MC70_017775 [Serratia marcescens]